MEMNGNKRVFQRQGGGSVAGGTGKVCNYWLQGRCNRHPCPYLHGDPSSHRQTKQSHEYEDGAPKRMQGYSRGGGGLVWRNPNAGGGPSKWGRGRGAPPGAGGGSAAIGGAPGARKGSELVCKYFLKGRCSYGESCKFLHSWSVGDDFSLLTKLEGHQKVRGL